MGSAKATLREHRSLAAGATLFAFAGIALLVRIPFGVDFTDESFYVALPYTFTLGHRPFADELALHQLSALLTEPLVRLYLWINGSNAGLVLFMRHAYLGIAVTSGLVAARALARVAGAGPSLAVASLVIAFVPFCIPSLGYNTVASLGLVCGLFSLCAGTVSNRPALGLFFGTFCLAFATIAYPPVAFATLPATASFGWLAVRRNDDALPEGLLRRTAPLWIAGFVVAIGLAARLGPHVTAENMSRAIELNDAIGMQGGGAEKLAHIGRLVGLEWMLLGAQAATCVAAALTLRFVGRTWLATSVLLFTGPALFAASTLHIPLVAPYTTMPFVIMVLAVGCPIALRLSRRALPQALRAGLSIVAATSIAAGASITWATANGPTNAALGLLPAALVTLALMMRIRPATVEPNSGATIPPFAFAASLVGFALLEFGTHVYHDAPIEELTATVETGPFAGLETSTERRDFIDRIQSDLAEVTSTDRTILVYDYFPAGYLMSESPPRTPALWMFLLPSEKWNRRPTRSVYAQGFEPPHALPDVTLEMRKLIATTERDARRPPWDPVRARLRAADYAVAVTRDRYVISMKGGAASDAGSITRPENDSAQPDPAAKVDPLRN